MKRVTTNLHRGDRSGHRPACASRDGASLSLTAMANELRLLHGARAAQEDRDECGSAGVERFDD